MIYNDLALFTSVARHLNFSAAAESSGIPLSRVSRRIAELEHHLGVKLFERTTRSVRLTNEGKELLDRCQGPVEALQDIAGFADNTREQTIYVTAPPLAARTTIGWRLLAFAAKHPEVKIELVTTNAMLDFFRDNIDLAFRLGPLSASNLVAKRLWDVPYCFCAGKGCAEAHNLNQPITAETLSELPAIVTRQPWRFVKGEQVQPKNIMHMLDEMDLLCQAVEQNFGVAMIPHEMLTDAMQEITLIDNQALGRAMFAVYPSRRLLPARIRNLIDFMAQ